MSANSRFVIQRHQARTLHFDFRLEKDGVFKSWSVPKGIPEESGVRHLAIQTDDHDLEFGDFQGAMPAGEYGAGTIQIWDAGTYELHRWDDDHIEFTLRGSRVNDRFHLIRFQRGGERAWLMFRASPSCGSTLPK